jgi:butyryl-CoA dehydrogenase
MLTTKSVPEGLQSESSTFLSESQRGWLKKARAFADAIPLEDVIRSDVDNVFRRDLFESACKEGLGSLPFPKTYGGAGGDYVSFCAVNEEFGRRCVPIMSSLGVHVLCQEPVYKFGTEAQKQKYLVPSSSGKFLAAFGLTEPGAGSDTAAIATTAKQKDDEYILNGTKTFITSGASADYYIVMAKLQPALSSQGPRPVPEKTITAFIVERGFPGFEIGQKFDMLGMRGYSTCEIVFNDCRVPAENLLGQPGEGRKVALGSLAKGRVTIAAQATGWAQGALDGAVAFLVEQQRRGISVQQLEPALAVLGELAVMVESARVLTYQAACSIDRNESDVTLAAMAKIQATDIAMRASTEAMSLMGPAGMDPKYLVERIFRDAKAGQIYEGTNQIQRMLIARKLTKDS